MAAETEGIALLSMYGDDEEEEEAAGSAEEEETAATALAEDDDGGDSDETLKDNLNKSNHPPQHFPEKSPQPFTSPSPLHFLDGAETKTLKSPFPHQTPTPQPPVSRSQLSSPLSLTSPSPPPAPVAPSAVQEYPDGQRARRSALVIVDYAQDETAMSPEAEVMEIEIYGRVIFGAELHVSDGNIEGTTPVISQSLTPLSQQEPLPPFDIYEQSKFEASIAIDFTGTEAEVAEVKSPSTVSTDMQIDKPMQNFLPPTVTIKCPEELQEKINKFLAYKRAGKSFNADLRNRKDYRNPNFLQHAVSYQDIDEIGTCFSKDVFDPHGYDKSDYYDEIEADLKRELERREQERKKSQKIDLVSGCPQPSGVAPALKTNPHIPAAGISSLLSSSLPPNSTTGDAARDSRTNKKSKWDKVDGDAKIPLPSGGHDNPPSVSVHASHLSAANAGTGYSAFAQLKRREAGEKKRVMESSKTSADGRQANIIYFLNREGRIEHPHLIRIHHLCHSALHLRDVKRCLSELRGKEMPDSFAWSYQRRYKKGLVWQDLMDDDLLTPISDSEYVLLGSLLPGADSKSDLFPSPEIKSSPESEEINVEEDGVLPEKVERSSPARGGGGRRHPWNPAHVLRTFRTCGAVDTVDGTLFAGGRSGVYGGLTKPAGSTRSPLLLKNSREDDKRESEAAGGGKSSRKAGTTHMPRPKCSQCGKPFNPEKLHSHMISCRGLKRSGK